MIATTNGVGVSSLWRLPVWDGQTGNHIERAVIDSLHLLKFAVLSALRLLVAAAWTGGVVLAANPLDLVPGLAADKVLGSIQTPAGFNTTIANSDINYHMDLGTWTYNVRLPSGYDPNNPSKKYGLVTWIDAGGGNVFPSSYAAALDAHDVIWLSGHNIGNSVTTAYRLGVAVLGAFRMTELYNIDPSRVYTGGLSGGGRVSSTLGYLRSDFFRGFIGRVGASLPAAIPNWECADTNSSAPDYDYEVMGTYLVPSVVLPAHFRAALMTQYGDFRRTENLAIYRYGHLNHGNTTRLIMRNGGHSDEVGPSFTDAMDFLYQPQVDVIWDRFENSNLAANVQSGKTVAGSGFTALSGNVSETTYSYNSVNHGVLKLTGTGAAVKSNDVFTWQNANGILLDARLRGETATTASQNQQIGLHIVPASSSGTAADQPGLHLYWCYGQTYRAELVDATGIRKTLATWEHTATHPMSLAATDKTFWGDTAAPDYAGKTKSFRGEDVRLVLNSGSFQITLNRYAANVTTASGVTLQCSDGSTPYAENLPLVLQGYWSDVASSQIAALPSGDWRLVLTNDAIVSGQACGNAVVDEIRVVGTTGPQAAPATLAVTAPSNGTRGLTWVQIHGATGYVMQRSTSPDSGFATLATVANNLSSYSDATAGNSGAYYYRVAALGSDGATGKWSPVAYAARSGTVPSAPTSPAVTYPASYQVRLAWTDSASTETGYRIERSPAGTAQWSLLVTALAANTSNYTDTTVLAGASYDYRISAYGTAGISGYATITATPTDVAPPAPTGLAATATYGDVSLTWTSVALAGSYKVKRATASGGPYTTLATGITGTSYVDTSYPAGTTCFYVVSAVSGGSQESANSSPASITPPVLAAPGNLTVAPGYGANTLTWDAAYDADGYIIRRSNNSGGPYTVVASGVVGDFHADTGLSNGTAYYYTVQSVSGVYLSALAGPVSGTPLVRPASASPATPVAGANLLLHLDASKDSTIIKDTSNKVSRWNDADGGTNYAAQPAAASQPTALTDAAGLPQIDFGNYVVSSTGAWMQFKNSGGSDVSLTTIRTVFAVMKGSNFLLGDGGAYHFHRSGDSATSPLWNSSYTSGNILNGSTRLNGESTPINGVSTDMPAGFWLASVQTTGNVTGGRLANDRNGRTGGQQIAEILMYNRALTDAERKATEDYLMLKWFGVRLPAPFTAPLVTGQPAGLSVLQGNSATFTVAASGRANTYQWRRNGAAITGANSATFTISSVQAADAGAYDVVIVNPSGTITSSAATLITYIDLAAPSGLAVALVSGEVAASWNAVAGASSYNLLRSRSSGSGFTTIASGITGTSYTDAGAAAAGGTFYYKVSSSNTAGSGPNSTPVAIVLPDTAPPLLPALNNLVIEATGPAGAAASFPATAADALDGPVSINYSPASGATFPLGETTVTATATDASGNNSITSFTVTVQDTTPPVITTPGDIYRTSFSGSIPVVFTTAATDAVSGSRPTFCTPASGATFPVGTTTVTVSSTDAAGNHATATFNVTVGTSVPVQSNLLLRVDASLDSSIIKDSSNRVSRWNDADGRPLYFAQGSGSLQPAATTDSTLGRTIVDFGPYSENSSAPGFSMQLNDFSGASATMATIRTVFAVMKGSNFLLGDGGRFDFHRGGSAATSPLWDGGFSSANIRNGQTYLNGGPTALVGTSTAMPSTYWLASVVTTGNVTASRLANDRGFRTGGQQIAEIVIYDRALTDDERRSVEAYLMAKWFPSPLQSWRQQYFGSSANTGTAADTYDADFDGLANLLEYALGTIPTSAASAAPPALATAGKHLTLTFNRIADPALIYHVEAGPDLSAGSWPIIWQSTGAQNTAGPVTVTDSTHDINTSIPPRRFLRLRVTTP